LSAIVVIVVAIPVAIAAVVVVIGAKAVVAGWGVFTITAAIVAGVLLLCALLYLVGLVCVPIAIFFPAYAMYFFAERFPALHARLYPAAQPLPRAPEAPPFSPPPEPIG
jgi:hypothetical protein